MLKQKVIVRDLAKKYKLDERVVDKIIRSPFLLVRDSMECLDNDTPVKIPYFGTFCFKYGLTQIEKQEMLLQRAVKKLTHDLYKLPENSEYRNGIAHSIEVIKKLIKERKGDPGKYGFEETPLEE